MSGDMHGEDIQDARSVGSSASTGRTPAYFSSFAWRLTAPDLRDLELGDGARELFGEVCDDAELFFERVIYPPDKSGFFHILEEVAADGICRRLVCRALSAEGDVVQIWTSVCKAVVDGEPVLLGLTGRQTDLGPNSDAEENLAYVLGHAPVLLMRLDREDRIRFAAGAGLEAMGLVAEEMTGVLAVEYEPLVPAKALLQTARRVPAFDTTTVLQGRFLQTHVRALKDGNGDYDGLTLLSVDVTAQHAAEDALRKSRDELDVILANVAESIMARRCDGSIAYVNAQAVKSMGAASAEEVLKSSAEALASRFDLLAGDGHVISGEELPSARALRGEHPEPMLIRYRNKETRAEGFSMLRASPVKNQTGGQAIAINVWWDVTESLRLQRMLTAEVEAQRILSQPDGLQQLPMLLEKIIRALGWDAAVMWTSTEENLLVPVASRYPPDALFPSTMDAAAVRVFSENRPLWHTVADGEVHGGSFATMCAVPLVARREARGVLSLFRALDFCLQPELMDGLARLGRIIGGYIDRSHITHRLEREHEARAQAEEAVVKAQLLAKVARAITTSFHDQSMLLQVARLLTAALADWVIVDALERGATVQRIAIAHRDAKHASDAEELRTFAPRIDVRTPLNEALKTGEPQLVAALVQSSDPQTQAWQSPSGATTNRARELTETMGAGSFVCVPLVGRQGVLGVLTCVRAPGPRAFQQRDLSFLQDIARQVAVGMESARLLESTQKALSARDEFLSIASHELRTPVTSLQLALQALERSITAAGTFDSFEAMLVSTARRQLTRLSKLLGDLLDVTRIRAGRLVLELKPTDLSFIVKDVAAQLESDFAKAQSPLEVSVPEHLYGNWDPARIEQVVVNLLSNAAKYGLSKPVRVALRLEGSMAVLTVSDSGIGIELSAQGSVFDPFVRAVSTRHYGGLGLGLYIVRRIVESHGGSIRLHSELNKGTTFTVELPGGSATPFKGTEGES